jgi:hypothetical protein
MRVLILAGIWMASIASLPEAHLLFSKNGSPVFEFRDNGTAWFRAGCAVNQSDAIESGELAIKYGTTKTLWTKSNGQVHIANTLHENAAFPGTGMAFIQNSQRNAELSTIGHLDLRSMIFKLWVQSIRFNHTTGGANSDALNIRRDRNMGMIYPEYSRGSWSLPAAYIANKQVGIYVQFGVQPSSVTSATLRGVSNDAGGSLNDAVARSVTFSNGASNEELFSISGTTLNKINKGQDYWDWTVVEGATNLFMEKTGPHTVYTILNAPASPWTQVAGDPQNPWIIALDFAIDPSKCNMQNATSAAAAATAAGTYLFNSYGLLYDVVGGSPAYGSGWFGNYDLTGYISKSMGNIVNCYDQAGSLMLLSSLVGCSVEYLFMGPFGYLNLTNLIGRGLCNNPFYGSRQAPYNVPIVGQDDANRDGFGNHAFVRLNGGSGTIYDDCGGPYLGSGNTQAFIDATIDKSTPAEEAEAGDISDITSYTSTTIE